MKKISFSVIALLVVFFGQAQKPKEKNLLWKIDGKGLKQPSYLFGTIHLMCPDQIKVDTVIKKNFASVKELYLELDMDDPQMMNKVMKTMSMTGNTTMENLVSKTDYDSMNTLFKAKTGMPMSLMGNAKPMLLMSALFPSLLGCAPEGWEKVFQDMAKAKNIPLKGLETIEFQMQVFDSIPYKVQATMLKDFLYNLDSTKKSFNDMLSLYLSKDINALQEMMVKDESYGNYEALLLNDRNKNWIPIIAEQIKQKPTFFAVGAAHLGGDNGLISLLRKKGFTVTAVSY